MTDKEFLEWMYNRLVCFHEEDERKDYMSKFRAIISSTDPEHLTPNVTEWRNSNE